MTRSVLVTGGATGIGRAVAACFATADHQVWITGRRPDALTRTATELGEPVTPVVCDHTIPEQVIRLAATLPPRLDVLVNGAGGNTDFDREVPGTLADIAAGWVANLNANLISAVLTTEALGDRLPAGGLVVHIGSIAADKGAGAYGAAKAALASWNVDLSRELGPRGITSNVVSPGYVEDTEFFRDRMTTTRRATLLDAADTGRAGTPADIAATVFFVASPEAGQITAQTICVNGGERSTR